MDECGADLGLGDAVAGEERLHQAEVARQQHAVLLPDDGASFSHVVRCHFIMSACKILTPKEPSSVAMSALHREGIKNEIKYWRQWSGA